MTTGSDVSGIGRGMAWFIGLAGALLVLGGLAVLIIARTQPPGIDVERAAERRDALATVRAADEQALGTAAVLNAEKGLYRIPIREAMELMVGKWQDPASGRADLLTRLEQATAQPPPAANPYE